MHVVACVHWYVPHHNGGAEMMLHTMLRALAERGHQVDVLESRAPLSEAYRHSGYVIDGIQVHPYRSDRDDMPAEIASADVVVTHLENTQRAAILARWMGKPCFILNHNDHPNTMAWSGEQDLYQVYNSEWLSAALQPVPNWLIVRPPVISAEYRTTPGDRVTLINLNQDKGALVLYALAERMPDVNFLGVVGAHGDQIVRRDLPNVEIVEHTKPHEMQALYGRTRVLLMPSIYESWGRCAVEALASGIPVIANPTNGLTEALGSAGVFADREDLDEWETCLRHVLKPANWRTASRAAKARSAELDDIREADLTTWIEAVEGVAA